MPLLPSEPVIAALLYGALAAGASAVGALPYAVGRGVPLGWLGTGHGLAAGVMLGIGYVLMAEGLEHGALSVVLGGALGVGYTHWTHAYSGTKNLDTLPADRVGREQGYKLILLYALHSASEGVAIGVAMSVDVTLGVFTAGALAIHNVAEASALGAILHSRDVPAGDVAGLSVVARAPQALLAVVAVALVNDAPVIKQSALGFAAGALLHLAMTELLPSAYARAPRRGIALVVSGAAGAVVLGRALL